MLEYTRFMPHCLQIRAKALELISIFSNVRCKYTKCPSNERHATYSWFPLSVMWFWLHNEGVLYSRHAYCCMFSRVFFKDNTHARRTNWTSSPIWLCRCKQNPMPDRAFKIGISVLNLDRYLPKLVCPISVELTYYYPYRAFGGQNKIVYSARFVRRAILF